MKYEVIIQTFSIKSADWWVMANLFRDESESKVFSKHRKRVPDELGGGGGFSLLFYKIGLSQ